MLDKGSWVSRRELLQGIGTTAFICGPAVQPATAGSYQPSSKNKKVRVGVVGGGFGCSFYWHTHPDSEVTAVCDLRDDRLKLMVERFRTDNTYKNFRTFLKDPNIDAVAVFTPAPLHVWMATEAMKVGKHVISAVPAGMCLEELEQLIEAVKKTGLKYMMAETSYYRYEVITCREWAQQGKFGTISYTEAEYHHEGLLPLMFDSMGFPTWRHGFPPMHYPTHCTGMVVPITGERLTEVQAVGWGDGHEVLKTNQYKNPFWNTVGFFKTSGGHCSRISVCWHVAAGGTERGSIYGDRMSYIMGRPEGSPNTVPAITQDGKVVLDDNGYPQGQVKQEAYQQPKHWEKLPPELRHDSGHGGSHTHITHEFIRAIVEDRTPAVDVYEAVAYTAPGIIAHQSALKGGELMKIRDYGSGSGTPARPSR